LIDESYRLSVYLVTQAIILHTVST